MPAAAGASAGRVNIPGANCRPEFFDSGARLARAVIPAGFNDRDTAPGRAPAVDCFAETRLRAEEEEDKEKGEEDMESEERDGEEEDEDAEVSASRRAVAGLVPSRCDSLLPGSAMLVHRL